MHIERSRIDGRPDWHRTIRDTIMILLIHIQLWSKTEECIQDAIELQQCHKGFNKTEPQYWPKGYIDLVIARGWQLRWWSAARRLPLREAIFHSSRVRHRWRDKSLFGITNIFCFDPTVHCARPES